MQPDRHALFRLLAVNGLAGGLLGIGFVIGILVLDVARIGTMLATSGFPFLEAVQSDWI